MNEIKILNNQQVYYYMENGVQPIRLECGRDNKVSDGELQSGATAN